LQKWISIPAAVIALISLAACSGSNGTPTTQNNTDSLVTPPPPPATPSTVTISGSVTFDRVPLNPATNGLDYNSITATPSRGVIVEAVDDGGRVLASDVTDQTGNYSVDVDSSVNVRIQVRSQMQQTTGAQWDITVQDNTSSNAVYILAGSLTDSGTADSTRNLNAASGWDGTQYSTTRAAGPFAILDSIYETVIAFEAIDATINFPPLRVFWSVNNRSTASGNVANGDVGTSFFSTIGGLPTLVILGAADDDTDEYDQHVVVHEFGHYFEAQLSRSNSIGGSHSLNDRLDPRVAHSEGFANALSAIILNDVFYRDSSGASQFNGFSFSLERNTFSNPGWFSEASVGSIVYDIFDNTDDGADVLSAGLAPIYTAMTSDDYRTSPEATTIFLLLDALRNTTSINNTSLTALATGQSISGTGPQGIGETNTGGILTSLPVYNLATVGGPPVEVCSTNDVGDFNMLGNRAFIRFSLAASQSTVMSLMRTSGSMTTDPDFFVFEDGNFIAVAEGTANGSETLTQTLAAGEYLIEAFEFTNTNDSGGRDACFNFTVQ